MNRRVLSKVSDCFLAVTGAICFPFLQGCSHLLEMLFKRGALQRTSYHSISTPKGTCAKTLRAIQTSQEASPGTATVDRALRGILVFLLLGESTADHCGGGRSYDVFSGKAWKLIFWKDSLVKTRIIMSTQVTTYQLMMWSPLQVHND